MRASRRWATGAVETLARLRRLIKAATLPWSRRSNGASRQSARRSVWEHAGLLCTGETYKDKVKLTFARGAALDDPAGLFNASL